MFMKVGKRFGWLAGLALCPVVGLGQVIIEHPQNQTVCVGESAVFTSETDGGFPDWYFNDIARPMLPPEISSYIHRADGVNTKNGTTIESLIVNYNETFNGVGVWSTVLAFDNSGLSVNSTAAYLFYETTQQFQVTGLIGAVNNDTAQIYWNAHNSNLTTQYFFGVYDHNNHLIANQTTDATHISYNLPPRANDTCQYLEFKVTANQCPDPENGFIQTEGATIDYREPNIDISTVTAEFNNNQTVLVSWTPAAGSGAYWVSFDGQGFDAGNPPFSYSPARCGEYDLTFFVSPAECPDQPGFTYSDTISFTIPCPTTATEATETEIPDQPSGTQASYPSLLLAVAAIIPLLRWQH